MLPSASTNSRSLWRFHETDHFFVQYFNYGRNLLYSRQALPWSISGVRHVHAAGPITGKHAYWPALSKATATCTLDNRAR